MSSRNSFDPSSSSPGLDPSTNNPRSPRSGSASAPVSLPTSAVPRGGSISGGGSQNGTLPTLLGSQRMASSSTLVSPPSPARSSSMAVARRRRSSEDRSQQQQQQLGMMMDPHTLAATASQQWSRHHRKSASSPSRSTSVSLMDSAAKAQSRSARKINDSMVYLDGPQIYTCAQCRTHLTSHDEIISKSFHGRHGRAYLFDHCVNVSIGPPEDRLLITGLHSVCDIFCKRCNNMVGWTYARAYETSQKYKEGKFIVEKINLHLEESDYYDVATPAGARTDRFRARSISWGSDCCGPTGGGNSSSGDRYNHQQQQQQEVTIYEYRPSSPVMASASS